MLVRHALGPKVGEVVVGPMVEAPALVEGGDVDTRLLVSYGRRPLQW